MTKLDLLILVVVVGSAAIGWRKGLIRQVGGIGGVVAGVLLCRIGSAWLTPVIGQLHDPDHFPPYADTVIANICLFFVGYLGMGVISSFLRNLTQALHIGILDRIGGAAFCLFEWLLLLSLGLNLWLIINPASTVVKEDTLFNGKMAQTVQGFAPSVLGWVSENPDVLQGVEKMFHHLPAATTTPE